MSVVSMMPAISVIHEKIQEFNNSQFWQLSIMKKKRDPLKKI